MFGREIPSNFSITYRRDTLAESLWQYGEEEIAEKVLTLSDRELHQIHRLTVWHHINDPEPTTGPKLQNGRINARAAIEFFEHSPRDTVRTRRRTRPEEETYDAGYLANLLAGRPTGDTPAERMHYHEWENSDRRSGEAGG